MPNFPFFKQQKSLPNKILEKLKNIFSKKLETPKKFEIRYLSLDEAIEQGEDVLAL